MGCAILWDNNTECEILPEGSARAAAISVHIKDGKMYMVTTYMPSRGKMQFQVTIDELQEIVSKYSSTHKIILCGDFNSSINRKVLNSLDKILKTFLTNNRLSQSDEGYTSPNLLHKNRTNTAQIDYVVSEEVDGLLHHSKIHQHSAISTSDHNTSLNNHRMDLRYFYK